MTEANQPRNSTANLIPIIVLTALLTSLFTALLLSILNSGSRTEADSTPVGTQVSAGGLPQIQSMDPEVLVNLFDQISPSIVRVSVIPEEGGGSGTEFVIRELGFILTNKHVVEGATSVSVILKDGTELPAEVLGRDPSTDLALLGVEAETPPPINLGDSDGVRIGQQAIVIGNPFGFDQSLTVSGDRIGIGTGGSRHDYMGRMESDASGHDDPRRGTGSGP